MLCVRPLLNIQVLMYRAYFLFILTLWGCGKSLPPIVHISPTESERQVYEAVLRALVAETPPDERVACISVPSVASDGYIGAGEQLLHALRSITPEVVPAAQCRMEESIAGSMRHLPTGRLAILYEVSAVTWENANTATLSGGWAATMLGGMGCDFRVVRKRKGWRVGKCLNPVMS